MKIYIKAHSSGVIVYHGSNEKFRGFDMDKQLSGYYPGFYVTTDKELSSTFGNFVYSFELLGRYYDLPDNTAAAILKDEARTAGHNVNEGSGYGECEYLKLVGYDGIRRGKTYTVFNPEKSLQLRQDEKYFTVSVHEGADAIRPEHGSQPGWIRVEDDIPQFALREIVRGLYDEGYTNESILIEVQK